MLLCQPQQFEFQGGEVVRLNLDQFCVAHDIDDVAIDRDLQTILRTSVVSLEGGVEVGFPQGAEHGAVKVRRYNTRNVARFSRLTVLQSLVERVAPVGRHGHPLLVRAAYFNIVGRKVRQEFGPNSCRSFLPTIMK